MAEPKMNELDLKMLERSAEQYEASRQSFFRDLKFVLPLLLLFQFLIFFRFTNLSERRNVLAGDISLINSNRAILGQVENRIQQLADDFQSGAALFKQQASNFPGLLRADILELEKDLKKFKSSPFPLAPALEETAIQSPLKPDTSQIPNAPVFQAQRDDMLQQSNVPRPRRPSFELEYRLFAGLTFEELKTMHAEPSENPAFHEWVNRIVETNIIHPRFESLNETWRAQVVRPLESERLALQGMTNEWRALAGAGLASGTILTNVQQAWEEVSARRFAPPGNRFWWRTVQGKLDEGREIALDADKANEAVKVSLGGSERMVRDLHHQLKSSADRALSQQRELEHQLLTLETNLTSLQAQMQDYFKPVPYVAFELRDAALYFPALLPAVFAIFVWRFVLLRRRGFRLADRYAQAGLSWETAAVAFPLLRMEAGRDPVVILSVAAMILLVGASWFQVWKNPSMAAAAPWWLYAGAAALLTGTLVLLLQSVKPGRPSKTI